MATRAPHEADYDLPEQGLPFQPEAVSRGVNVRAPAMAGVMGAAFMAAGIWGVGHLGESAAVNVSGISTLVDAHLNHVGTPPETKRLTATALPNTNVDNEAVTLGVTPAILKAENPILNRDTIHAGMRLAYTKLEPVSAADEKIRQKNFQTVITNPEIIKAEAVAVPEADFSSLSAYTVIFTKDTARTDFITGLVTLPGDAIGYKTSSGFIVKPSDIAVAYTMTNLPPAAPAATPTRAGASARTAVSQSDSSTKHPEAKLSVSHEQVVRSHIVNTVVGLYDQSPNQSPLTGGNAWSGLRAYINAWRGTPADSQEWLPYCSLGVSYFYDKAGYPFSGGPGDNPSALSLIEDLPSQNLEAPVTLQDWFQQHGHYWDNKAGGEMPQPGDVLFLSPNGDGTLTHTAIAVKVDGNHITYVAADDGSSLTVNMDTVNRDDTSYVVAFGSLFSDGHQNQSSTASPNTAPKSHEVIPSDLTPKNLKAFLLSEMGQESTIDWATRPNYDTASGGFQVIHSLWNNYHGYSDAYLAPASVQYKFAVDLFTYYYQLYQSDPQRYSRNDQLSPFEFLAGAWYAGPGFVDESDNALSVQQAQGAPSILKYIQEVTVGDGTSYHPSMLDYLNGHKVPKVPGLARSVYDPNY